jgi:hypothetical protein
MDDSSHVVESVAEEPAASVSPVRMVVFAVLSAGFVIWLSLGQLEARVWVSGRLTFLDRRIASMWQYLGNNLPDMPAPVLISMLFWLSISFVVVGTIAGLWLILCTPEQDIHDETWESIHAAHLHHDSH